ncbi:MAG TPA: cytochrome c oxidase subunit 3 [Terriglobales bacterium]|nr:cytochrome c oxidase subunit 3 [Terriglobales bacterium]
MSTAAIALDEIQRPWSLPNRGKVAMACLIFAESAIFTIFVVAYLFYMGKSLTGPTPHEVLETPIFFTICLLSSSLTIHFAARSLKRDHRRLFLGFWLLTIALGGSFLYGTAQEWHRLIYHHGLTISTNLFGTTYYSLVGLHAFHVTAGLAMMLTVAVLGLSGRVGVSRSGHIEVLSMYWHFVDAVWVVVFTVVYVLGR